MLEIRSEDEGEARERGGQVGLGEYTEEDE
jgi:hypothetical protein